MSDALPDSPAAGLPRLQYIGKARGSIACGSLTRGGVPVYAGSAQIAALPLIAAGAPMWIV